MQNLLVNAGVPDVYCNQIYVYKVSIDCST